MYKCTFAKNGVTFLGHQLNRDDVKLGRIKTMAVNNFSIPTKAVFFNTEQSLGIKKIYELIF